MPAARTWPEALLLSTMLLLGGCGGDPGTGPVDVHWDRDACERCRMVLSDRRFAAEVRGGPAGQPARIHKFDDPGCAMLWLEQQPWRDDVRTEVWVADHHDGHWIDARSAWYVPGLTTPMAYGLGAQTERLAGALDYGAALDHVHRVEARFSQEGGVSLDPSHVHPAD